MRLHIKVLQTLRAFALRETIDIQVLKDLKEVFDRPRHGEGQALALRKEAAFFHRSAGACPPRALMARDRPSSYVRRGNSPTNRTVS